MPDVMTTPVRMTSAEFRVARETLGLTTSWLATQFGVDERTVRRWDTGENPVPDARAALMLHLIEFTDDFITQVIDGLDCDGDSVVVVYREDEDLHRMWPAVPYPASWHRAAMGRVAAQTGIRLKYLEEPYE
ncbi:helix-turn-helix domain-containing protein [Gordonia sihwensis]|uniref:helix-turn-helix domain-containing protein n=1 Tax=Gordonia sihwensis TaxID=173559 RepID=UPI0005EE5193|nr:transcriptional regulator [Gordonia sihwensis]KJR10258.1 hypothetical protein UG54_01375 [Gordonia sihwensis]